MGNKPATTTTTQNQSKNPWAPTIAPLTGIVNKATDLAGNVDNFTPTYSDQTRQGVQRLTDLANSGQPGGYDFMSNIMGGAGAGFNTGVSQLQSVANGSNINGNPHLDPVIQRTIDDTTRGVNSQFAAGGRYGSGAHTGSLGREVGNAVGNMRLSNYNTERTAQDNAARTLYGGGLQGGQFAGQLDQLAKNPALTALQAGQLQDQMDSSVRQAPMNALQWQAGMINPIAGQGGTSSSVGTQKTEQPTNWMTTGLGAGMMGLGALTGNPALMASGAGGLMGGLGGGGGGGFSSSMFGGLGSMFKGGGGNVNGYANNDPGGSYYV